MLAKGLLTARVKYTANSSDRNKGMPDHYVLAIRALSE